MNADISKVLGEMRALQARIRPTAPAATEPAGSDFAAVLKDSVDRVADMQMKARSLASAWESGDRSVDLARVMLETQKASLAFRAMTEVRNKLIDAYHEIMNMQV